MTNLQDSAWLGAWIQAHEFLFILVLVWVLFWTGLALWHSARRSQSAWFLLFFIVHTLGILEIIYLFGVLKLKPSELFRA